MSSEVWYPGFPLRDVEPEPPYDNDLRKLSCKCPDWVERRSWLPRDHPGHGSQHLRNLIPKAVPLDMGPDYIGMLATGVHLPDPEEDWLSMVTSGERLLVSVPHRSLAYAYRLPGRPGEAPYVFSLDEDEWVSTELPNDLKTVQEEIWFWCNHMKFVRLPRLQSAPKVSPAKA